MNMSKVSHAHNNKIEILTLPQCAFQIAKEVQSIVVNKRCIANTIIEGTVPAVIKAEVGRPQLEPLQFVQYGGIILGLFFG